MPVEQCRTQIICFTEIMLRRMRSSSSLVVVALILASSSPVTSSVLQRGVSGPYRSSLDGYPNDGPEYYPRMSYIPTEIDYPPVEKNPYQGRQLVDSLSNSFADAFSIDPFENYETESRRGYIPPSSRRRSLSSYSPSDTTPSSRDYLTSEVPTHREYVPPPRYLRNMVPLRFIEFGNPPGYRHRTWIPQSYDYVPEEPIMRPLSGSSSSSTSSWGPPAQDSGRGSWMGPPAFFTVLHGQRTMPVLSSQQFNNQRGWSSHHDYGFQVYT